MIAKAHAAPHSVEPKSWRKSNPTQARLRIIGTLTDAYTRRRPYGNGYL